MKYVFSSSRISRTFFSYCVLSIITVARPLSACKIMFVSFLPNAFNAFLSSLLMLDLEGFADFKVPFISARKFSASVCGSVEQDCLWQRGARLFSGFCLWQHGARLFVAAWSKTVQWLLFVAAWSKTVCGSVEQDCSVASVCGSVEQDCLWQRGARLFSGFCLWQRGARLFVAAWSKTVQWLLFVAAWSKTVCGSVEQDCSVASVCGSVEQDCLWQRGARLFSGYYILLYWDMFRCYSII